MLPSGSVKSSRVLASLRDLGLIFPPTEERCDAGCEANTMLRRAYARLPDRGRMHEFDGESRSARSDPAYDTESAAYSEGGCAGPASVSPTDRPARRRGSRGDSARQSADSRED